MDEARDVAVYAATIGNGISPTAGNQILYPNDAQDGDPSLLLAKGTYTRAGAGKKEVIEIVNGHDSEGKLIGFNITTRLWSAELDQ